MEVILSQDYPALGYVGDRVKVKGGYARNFLIPRGIALEASSNNERLLKHKLGGVNAKKVRLRSQAQELAGKLEALNLEFTLRVGEAGKTYGSVTARDIEAALQKEGFVIDRRQIVVLEPIRKAGEHKVSVKLHSEVAAQVALKVNTDLSLLEASAKEAPEGEGQKAEKKARGKKGRAAKESPPGAAEGSPEGGAQAQAAQTAPGEASPAEPKAGKKGRRAAKAKDAEESGSETAAKDAPAKEAQEKKSENPAE